MMKNTLYARTGALPAIAAVLALSSTAAFAQEAQPVSTDPAPVAVAPPAPVVEAPAIQATGDSAATSETSDTAPTTASSPVTKARKPIRTAQHVVAAKVGTTRSNASTAVRAAAPVLAAPPVAPAAPPSAPLPSNAPAPIAPDDVIADRPATNPAAVANPANIDRTWPIVGGALALLVLGGGAVAFNRRRRVTEEQFVEEPIAAEPAELPAARTVERPVYEEQPAIIAPPAFAWGKDQPLTTATVAQTDDADDRNPGESWMDRAHRGPSAGNPSVSLRNRLKRAAFFDKRERDAAAGTAEPVDPTAGLPETLIEEQQSEHA